MQIAYIILAHKNPEQIATLIRSLANEDTSFFIHIDKRAGDEIYSKLVEQLTGIKSIHYTKRYKCYWGDFNIVKATIACIQDLMNSGRDFDYAILLSGQDYLIKPIDNIKEFFKKYRGQEFIESFALDTQNKWTEHESYYQALRRVNHWHFRIRSKHIYLPIKRQFSQGFEPYGGSQWWGLSRDCIEYINSFIKKNPVFVNYFKYVCVPDEIFFQTIVSNSPFKNKIFNSNLTYVGWENSNPVPRAILGKDDLATLLNSPKLFARKFDITREPEILDLIDREILGLNLRQRRVVKP